MEHQGNLLFKIIKRKRFPISVLARNLCISRTMLYKKFQEQTLSTSFLYAVGKVIGYNFSHLFPQVAAFEDNERAILETKQRKYIGLLEQYTELFLLSMQAMNEVKQPSIRQNIMDFIKKEQRLPWKKSKG